MGRLLVHITTGPENPTRAPLGLLVARSALEAGHDVDLFIAGDGVAVLRPETLDAGNGIGTGSLREHVDALVVGGARFYASGMSSKPRSEAALADDLLSLREAAARSGLSASHLRLLARNGRLGARKLGRDWFTTHPSYQG